MIARLEWEPRSAMRAAVAGVEVRWDLVAVVLLLVVPALAK